MPNELTMDESNTSNTFSMSSQIVQNFSTEEFNALDSLTAFIARQNSQQPTTFDLKATLLNSQQESCNIPNNFTTSLNTEQKPISTNSMGFVANNNNWCQIADNFTPSLNTEQKPILTNTMDFAASNNTWCQSADNFPTPVNTEIKPTSTNSTIPFVPIQDEVTELQSLVGVCVYNQSELEEGILQQFDQQDKERTVALAKKEVETIQTEIRAVKQRLSYIDRALAMPSADKSSWTKETRRQIESIKREKENKEKQMKRLLVKQRTLLARVDGQVDVSEFIGEGSEDGANDNDADDESRLHLEHIFGQQKKESDQEKLIRTGHMTPFGTVVGGNDANKANRLVQSTGLTDFEKYLLNQEELNNQKKAKKRKDISPPEKDTKKKKKVKGNTEKALSSPGPSSWKNVPALSPPKQKKNRKKEDLGTVTTKKPTSRRHNSWTEPEQVIDLDDTQASRHSSDSEYLPSDDGKSDEFSTKVKSRKKSKSYSKRNKILHSVESSDDEHEDKSSLKRKRQPDDGNESDYLKRIRKWQRERSNEKKAKGSGGENDSDDSNEECQNLEDGFKIPSKIWNKLYKYQQTCVQWLWELHCQQCGGIIGDEMGLGKTIQIIAFLSGLWYSKMITRGDKFRGLGPVLIVAPTTLMHQWVREFHTWWPPFRVGVLHESGSYSGTKESLIRHMNNSNGVLITSYGGVNLHQQLLLRYDWHYVILDEGHKIRNPDAQITLACKQFPTPHRLILSGSPLQNNLKELWSLFDFIFPGKLGTMPVFMEQFSVPITLGGYANASEVQIRVAFKCATVLRDTINPYLLRRMKSDVKMNLSLPNKNEQVLFCQLTDEQRNAYKQYLESDQLKSIMDNRLQVFVGLVSLRKICNHPDLYTGGPKHFGDVDEQSLSQDERYGFWKRSGKMIVVESILKIWHEQKHRVLFFSQSRQLLHIMEYFVKTCNYSYLKMDGTTTISSRQPLINKFNSDESIFLFLLTTRVGGLGVNLTGADRVIIFDPDWNPSTDLQAKERVWRIGQQKNVTIYRLLTAGTIEEKIYHRQIFKQFLTNRVLKDPRQRRFFKNNELYELFTLQEQGKEGPETLAVFAGTGSEIKWTPSKKKGKPISKKTNDKKKTKTEKDGSSPIKNAKTEDCVHNEMKKVESEVLGDNQIMHIEQTRNEEVLKSVTGVTSDTVDGVDPTANDTNHDTKLEIDNVLETETTHNKDSLTDQKCFEMRELAKRLSQQFAHTLKKKDETKSGSGNLKQKHEAKKQDERRSKGKRTKGTVFEGKKIQSLVRQETFQSLNEADQLEKSNKHDDYVLKKLFAKTGLKSALRHDKIMEAPEADYALVEGEAERVAKDAVKKLKQSRKFCFQACDGIPNWTGSKETLPSKSPKPRFGQKKNVQLSQNMGASTSSQSSTENNPTKDVQISTQLPNSESYNMKTNTFVSGNFSSEILSSQQLLSKIKERSFMSGDPISDSEEDNDDIPPTLPVLTTEHDELLVDLRNFIAFQAAADGQTTTKELLEHFRPRLPTYKSSIFKALLYQICDFSKESRTWYLKSEFR